MMQVLFVVPIVNLPLHGFGVTLALALLLCGMASARLAKRSGGDPEMVYDLLFWLAVGGVFGARLFYVIQYHNEFKDFWQFFQIWRGGLVVYGSLIGGFVVYWIYSTMKKLPKLWLADIIAPSLALGIAVGRIGCFLNGCCFGDYCQQPMALAFPAQSDPTEKMISLGLQSRLGFQLAPPEQGRPADRRIWFVEPGCSAEKAGIRPGDEIIAVNGVRVLTTVQAQTELDMAGRRNLGSPGAAPVISVETVRSDAPILFRPQVSLPIHPTQIYSSVGCFCLFLFLYSYFPYRRRNGEVIAFAAIAYSIGRFMIEFLRFDENPFPDGLTISQNVSIPVLLIGVFMLVYLRREPLLEQTDSSNSVTSPPEPAP